MTQPYIPRYRVRLFDLIHSELKEHNFDFRVFWGSGRAQRIAIKDRNDAADGPWAQEVRTIEVPARPGNPFILRRIPTAWSESLLVTEMQVSNLNAWSRLATRRPFVTVGHGRSYLGNEPEIAILLETVLNRRASHVCTYTQGGRKEVLKRTRLPPSHVTSFNNATGSATPEKYRTITDAETSAFKAKHGIPTRSKIAFYIGALAPYKRIDLLSAAFQEVCRKDENWWLIVAGDGPDRKTVERLQLKTGRVTILGNTPSEEAAIPAKAAQIIVNPGRVGLVAVDALAWNLPLLTTSGALHAPEFDYLTEGENVCVSAPTPEALAAKWLQPWEGTYFPPAPTVENSAHTLAAAFMRTAQRIIR